MTRQFYFIRDGVEYPIGTILHMKGYDVCGKLKITKMTFLYYIPDSQTYFLKHEDSGKTWIYKESMFSKYLVEIPGTISKSCKEPVKKYRKDSEIFELYVGWLWYILWMVFATILKEAVAGWILGSIIFFTWKNKIREEKGSYYEW